MNHLNDMKQPLIFMVLFLSFFYGISLWKDHNKTKDDTTYHFSSYIKEDTYSEFVKSLPENTTTVSLSSGGGNLEVSLRMGSYIKELGLDTEVDYGKSCSSACMYLLVSGKNITVNGTVGLHEPSINGIKYRHTSGAQRRDLVEAKPILRDYIERRGFSGHLIDYSYTIKGEEMKYLKGSEFLKYKIR